MRLTRYLDWALLRQFTVEALTEMSAL